uniref:Uncharacterized protein n=1 Tax=Anguilla anguilla TaxID=7936 RepID=A0A0E9TU64_ANGAN
MLCSDCLFSFLNDVHSSVIFL